MNEHQASRTLLKSPPELWAECSDAQSLARHLDTFFGEIRITRLEPESTVAWEGESASGTVKLEPSGWGTRVTLTCSTASGEEPASTELEPAAEAEGPSAEEPAPAAEPAPSPEVPLADTGRGGLFTRMMRFFGPQQPQQPPAEASATRSAPQAAVPASAVAERSSPESPPPAPEPSTPQATEPDKAADPLTAALESLGQAHHRPFSRA